jgi:hypothetical protein
MVIMRIVKERKLKEAQRINFYELGSEAFPDDRDSQKGLYDVKNIVDKSINEIYSGDPSPAVLYFNLTNRFNGVMDKVAADYITGKKDYTQELDTFTEDLSNALKQTDKVTKNIISKLQAMNKYLLKLPEKE